MTPTDEFLYRQACRIRDELEAGAKRASDAWNAILGVGQGAMGLTPDSVKASPAYRAASRAYQCAAADLRECNRYMAKRFKRELTRDRAARRAAILTSNRES